MFFGHTKPTNVRVEHLGRDSGCHGLPGAGEGVLGVPWGLGVLGVRRALGSLGFPGGPRGTAGVPRGTPAYPGGTPGEPAKAFGIIFGKHRDTPGWDRTWPPHSLHEINGNSLGKAKVGKTNQKVLELS